MSATLHQLFEEARGLGFLGPGPVQTHLDHALAFAGVVETACAGVPPRSVVDLGSGAGVPGLVLAIRWDDAAFLLVEVHGRRAAFLDRAIRELGLEDRVDVVAERAEILGHTAGKRSGFDVVTARGFGRPAVVAECAAPLLRLGGMLVVSEPPADRGTDGSRWPSEGLAELGMGPAESGGSTFGFVVVRQEQACPPRYPRRVGVPAKRPIF